MSAAGSVLPYMQPRRVRAKWATSSALKVMVSSRAPSPTMVAWPPRRVTDHAVRMVCARPTHSMAWSTPRPPVSARMRLPRSSPGSSTSVAPSRRASSAFSGAASTAMITAAPGDPRALHRAQADAAEPDDGDGVAGPDAAPR